jgi:glycosyltransferase involved in cell wall biosynthesis
MAIAMTNNIVLVEKASMDGNGVADSPRLSFAIPCYNEEENVAAICEAVATEAIRHNVSYEIILIDNGSTDQTRQIIRQLCAQDARVKAIFNSRNFGQMRSPTHAIYQASGDYVIGMCADFQDPPTMIGEFLKARQEGHMIVLAQRQEEKTSMLLKWVRNCGYALMVRYADVPPIPNVTGFGLYDRRVVDTLKKWNDPEPLFRVMLVESGFPVKLLPVERPERRAGKTKNNYRTLLDFALSSLAHSSKNMLRLPLFWAVFAAMISAFFMVSAIIALFLGGPALILSLFSVQFGICAITLFCLGLIGIHIRLISERTRNVDLVVEQERINF